MVNNFPRIFANRAMMMYFAVLASVSVLFISNSMHWYWMVFGAIEVCSFFYFSSVCPRSWERLPDKRFEKNLLNVSMCIRLCYVVFSYFFYKWMTGYPFEFHAADAQLYDAVARDVANTLAGHGRGFASDLYGLDYSDRGYPFYLGLVYAVTGNSVFISRVIKAVLGAWSVVLVYRLSTRSFGPATGRLAGVFCMLMPNLVYYCGLQLKETEMLFLCLLFLERADFALRAKGPDALKAWLFAIGAAGLLFTFRNALGLISFLSLGTVVFFSSNRFVTGWKRFALGSALALGFVYSAGSQVYEEASGMYEIRDSQAVNMEWRSAREGGNKFASKASAAVFAPMIFTIPFPTVVNIDGQENQQFIHGGNFVKNVLSLFTILALFMLLFSREWKEHVLPIAFLCGYLVVLAFSSFAQSERFHLPALPLELMFAAYAVTHLKVRHIRWYNLWLCALFVVDIAWSWFKLAGRR